MPAVTIDLIKELRDRTGAGIMDCKKALIACDGEIENAIDWLREKGIAKAASKAGRVAAEGLALVRICDKCGKKAAIVEVNCETDFVSASDKFHQLVEGVLDVLMEKEPATVEEAKALTQDLFANATVAMGEKFDLRRFEIVKIEEGQSFGSYIHMGGKIGVLVIFDKENLEIAKPIAMSVAADNPSYISLEDVPAADRDRERNIAKTEVDNDPKLAGKPDAMKAQIIERKVDKVLSQSCFDLQGYILDQEKTCGQVLKENNAKILRFIRYQVGEGIAK
ncbi:MAG: elongation factor Ts [Bacilli bacterium]|nr:elongation factor Ts [Bacilli bacterium]